MKRLLPNTPAAVALWVGALSAAAYALVPFPGDHQWDALMTASALARPDAIGSRELFFFAHPLVIPLTMPFFWLVDDPLVAAGLREAFFGGVVVTLVFLGVRATTTSRIAGLVAALGLTLAASRWRLATGGEEKEIALAFGGAFLLLYMDHRKHFDLGLVRWRACSPTCRRITLALLLAVAVSVHLVNGLLAAVVVSDVCLDGKRWRDAAKEATAVLVPAGLLAGSFFLWLAIFPGGAQSAGDVTGFFLEYHLSGEFVSLPSSIGARFVEAFLGGRRWLAGSSESPMPLVEMLLSLSLACVLVWRALRHAPAPILRLLAWLGFITLHFFFYEPWDPEAWGPAAMVWSIVLVTGLFAPGRGQRWRIGAAGVALATLLVCDGAAYRGASDRAAGARDIAVPSHRSPSANLARWVDEQIESDAVIVVSDRLVASYFHIYTDRDPIILSYLDHSDEQLRRDFLLTTMSLAFYRPHMTTQQLRVTRRPIYLLIDDDSETIGSPIASGWASFRLGRWRPAKRAASRTRQDAKAGY